MSDKLLMSGPVITQAPGRQDRSVRRFNLLGGLAKNDVVNGGRFRVIGTTAIASTPDVPVSRLVILFDTATKRPIRSVIGSPTGVYEFRYVRRGPFLVIGFDHTGEYNAVVADNIFGGPM